ncbi:MAG: hypothetical protein ABIS01_05235, partial [Ferruginibacter sp.]
MHIFSKIILMAAIFFGATAAHAQVKKKTVKKPAAIHAKPKPKAKPKPATAIKPVKAAGTRVKITTDMGDIVVRLYDKTPRHRDNFIKLVSE